MSIAVAKKQGLTVYCGDEKEAFRPFPAKESLPEFSEPGQFCLAVDKAGRAVFQIILASAADCTVTDICAEGLTSLSHHGYDIYGNAFRQTMSVEAGKPWPFWCLVDTTAPEDGSYPICITLAGGETISFAIHLVTDTEKSFSVDDKDSLARLAWLNSREGIADTVPAPFTPVRLQGNTVYIQGREITLCPDGAIGSIQSRFTGINNRLAPQGRELLRQPFSFAVCEEGRELSFAPGEFSIEQQGALAVCWRATNRCGELQLTVTGTLEYDGTARYSATLENGGGRSLSVQLRYCPQAEFARYFMGLGLNGQKLPESHLWRWDEEKRQDSFWCGSMNGGVFVCPTGEKPVHPFVNIYFHHSVKNMPQSWVNDGKGTFRLTGGGQPTLIYDSGSFPADRAITFAADWAITPFKLTDMTKHWNTHFYHDGLPTDMENVDSKLEDAVKNDCTYFNLHHGNDILPFLNYPMYNARELQTVAQKAHALGLGFKPYYTVRELTTRLPELFAFRSLRSEIYPKPTYNQGGISWQHGVDPFLTENFGEEIIPAWKHVFEGGKYGGLTDPTVITDPYSRLANFYVKSIDWMIDRMGIDGLYIDDVGYGKEVMRRVRRVFEKHHRPANIDFHSWNHFEDDIGAGFGHNTLIYMQLLPYIDSLWFGESFDYDSATPEYLLTEVSGLPFGLMGELLHGNCNIWRGMLFGMTGRYPCTCNCGAPNPVPVWRMRKAFETAEMIGFWEPEQPVTSGHPQVLCTCYVCAETGRTLCCFASFSDETVTFTPRLTAQGQYALTVPYIEGIQAQQTLTAGTPITLQKSGGLMMFVQRL